MRVEVGGPVVTEERNMDAEYNGTSEFSVKRKTNGMHVDECETYWSVRLCPSCNLL